MIKNVKLKQAFCHILLSIKLTLVFSFEDITLSVMNRVQPIFDLDFLGFIQ